MSNAILSSNANSSLINTLLGSESVKNPNIYSTEEITPPYAATWQRCDPTTATSIAGRTQSFEVMKYGYMQQALLCWDKSVSIPAGGTALAAAGVALSANDVIRCIDSIELMSAGRVVSMMTGDDLFAQFSDLTESDSIPVRASALGERTSAAGIALSASETFRYCVPVVFPQFESIDTQLNCQFLEGLSFRVKWGVISNTPAATAIATIVADSAYMRLRFKAYPEEQVSEVLSANFDQPELAQLSARWYSEPPESFTAAAAVAPATTSTGQVTIELKNTDCVEDIFVMVYVADATTAFSPVKIDSVSLQASGQVLVEMSHEELLYSRLGEHGWSCSQSIADSGTGANVAKMQQGLYTWYKLSNTLSLRELNAPKVLVNVSGLTPGAKYSARVSEKCSAIFSTTSATGRYNVALSN
jgi:hypothetical protein